MRQATTLVKSYKHTDHYRRDAGKLSKKGWTVQSVDEHAPSRSFWFKITFGLFTMFFPKRKEIVVTYTRPLPA